MKDNNETILPGTFDLTSAVTTIILSLSFSLLGIWMFQEHLYIFPVLFGFAIPIANWNKLETKFRIHKLIISVIASVVLFHIAIFSSSSLTMMYVIAVINALILLLIYSFLIEHLDPSPITYVTTALLCIMAVYFGLNTTNRGTGNLSPEYLFVFWTFSFTAGLTTGLRRTKTGANKSYKI